MGCSHSPFRVGALEAEENDRLHVEALQTLQAASLEEEKKDLYVTAGKANQDDSDEEWGIWSAEGKKEGAEGEEAKKAQEPAPFTRILLKGTGKGKGNGRNRGRQRRRGRDCRLQKGRRKGKGNGGGNRGRRRSRNHGRHKDQHRDNMSSSSSAAGRLLQATIVGLVQSYP